MKAITQLKMALMQAPALAYPNPNQPFVLKLAVTEQGLGAVVKMKVWLVNQLCMHPKS